MLDKIKLVCYNNYRKGEELPKKGIDFMKTIYIVETGRYYEEFATYREAEIFCGERGIYAPDAIFEEEVAE